MWFGISGCEPPQPALLAEPVTARRGGLFGARAERQNPGQIANELDPSWGSAVLKVDRVPRMVGAVADLPSRPESGFVFSGYPTALLRPPSPSPGASYVISLEPFLLP